MAQRIRPLFLLPLVLSSFFLAGCEVSDNDTGNESATEVAGRNVTQIVFRQLPGGPMTLRTASPRAPATVMRLGTDAGTLRSALAGRGEIAFTLLGRNFWVRPDADNAPRAAEVGVWGGTVMAEGRALGPATFVLRNNRVYATISDGRQGIELASRDGGATFLVRAIDVHALPNEAPPVRRNVGSVTPSGAPPEEQTSEIDLLLLYTPGVVSQMNEFGIEMEDYVATQQKLLDKVYLNGANNLPVRVRIAHHEVYSQNLPATALGKLNQLSGDTAVATLRDTIGADLVALIVPYISDACGIGHFYNSGSDSAAFTVTEADCQFKYTLPHEIGHNLGADHARGDDSDIATQCNYGYRIASKARTLMAYECASGQECPRQPYFSDPSISFGGSPMGLACTATNPASNVDTVRTTISVVSAYRARPQP